MRVTQLPLKSKVAAKKFVLLKIMNELSPIRTSFVCQLLRIIVMEREQSFQTYKK